MGFAFTASLICAGAFAALFLFTLARGKVTREGRFVLAASAVTAAWALATAWSDALPSLLPVLETAQGLIWLALLEMLLRPQGRDAALRPQQHLEQRQPEQALRGLQHRQEAGQCVA